MLIRRSLEDANGELTIDEVRLMARGFCALPTEVIFNENIPIFDKASVCAHEQSLQNEAQQQQKKLPMNRGTSFKTNSIPDVNLMSILSALANIISHYKDAQASYFALYTVLNLVYSINLNPPTVQG